MAQSHPIIHFSQYAAARTAAMLLGLFPIDANLRTARWVGSMLWQFDKKHRQRAMENLRASFPEKGADQPPQARRHYHRHAGARTARRFGFHRRPERRAQGDVCAVFWSPGEHV